MIVCDSCKLIHSKKNVDGDHRIGFCTIKSMWVNCGVSHECEYWCGTSKEASDRLRKMHSGIENWD